MRARGGCTSSTGETRVSFSAGPMLRQIEHESLSQAVLRFANGANGTIHASLLNHRQKLTPEGRIEVEIPFNAPPDRPCRVFIDNGADVFGGGMRTEEFAICDQYTIQGDLFSRAILEDTPVATPIEDATANMRVIEAIVASTREGRWTIPGA